jgi:flagellar secretion chaperone FliS
MMYAEYDEQEVLDRDPIDLVRLLYGKAIEKLSLARTLTGRDRIQERNTAIARVSEILIELQASLDAEKGGAIARELARLYEYVQLRLAAGLAEGADEPLAEALQLLETLADGWREACQSLGDSTLSAAELEPELTGAGRTWTL